MIRNKAKCAHTRAITARRCGKIIFRQIRRAGAVRNNTTRAYRIPVTDTHDHRVPP